MEPTVFLTTEENDRIVAAWEEVNDTDRPTLESRAIAALAHACEEAGVAVELVD